MDYSEYVTTTLLPILIFLTVLPSQTDESFMPTMFSGHHTVFNTSDCDKDLDVFRPNTNGQWPAKIESPKYESYLDPSKKLLRLNITWKSDIENVKGFKIVLKPSGKPEICRILDYTDAITNSSLGVYRFQFNLNSIYKHIDFTAELSPLPIRDDSTVVISKFDSVDCVNFASKLLAVDYDGRYLLVRFSKGPKKCNYQKYEITVYNKTEKRNTSKIVPTKVGIYRETANSCPCRNREGRCEACNNSKTEYKYFLPEKRCDLQVMPDGRPVEPDQNKLLFPFGIVIGLMLVTALALYITHWKLSVHFMVRKRGIVLLLDDHEHHTNAVTKVVDYLNEYHLKIYLASTFLKNPDIPNQMVIIGEVLKSDFVLLVLSPALQKRMEAWDKQQDYVEFFKEKNSNILSKAFLELLLQTNKLLVCKFDHAAEFGRWPKPCYSLPTDLTRMVAELSGQSFSQRLILCNCFKSNALQRELQIAIKKTTMFEQSNINWFLEKYVCPTNMTVPHFDEISQGSSLRPSEYTNLPKLKDVFTGYKDTFIGLPEESITTPSIYSVPISERLEAINKRNS